MVNPCRCVPRVHNIQSKCAVSSRCSIVSYKCKTLPFAPIVLSKECEKVSVQLSSLVHLCFLFKQKL